MTYRPVAKFSVDSAFKITGLGFFMVGKLISGTINIGDYIDLNCIQLNLMPKIFAIEFTLKYIDGKAVEDPAIGVTDLTADEAIRIQNSLGSLKNIDIIKKIKCR